MSVEEGAEPIVTTLIQPNGTFVAFHTREQEVLVLWMRDVGRPIPGPLRQKGLCGNLSPVFWITVMIAPSSNAVCVPSTMLRIEMPLFSTVCLYKVELLSNIDTHVIPPLFF